MAQRGDSESQWKKHPGTLRMTAAWPALSKALIHWQHQHGLTDLEVALSVSEYQGLLFKNLVRTERASGVRRPKHKEDD